MGPCLSSQSKKKIEKKEEINSKNENDYKTNTNMNTNKSKVKKKTEDDESFEGVIESKLRERHIKNSMKNLSNLK